MGVIKVKPYCKVALRLQEGVTHLYPEDKLKARGLAKINMHCDARECSTESVCLHFFQVIYI